MLYTGDSGVTNYSLICAVAENMAIGKDNKIPWHIPEDLKLFKKLTTGNIIIMGRKTFESIGKPLPGRISIIISTSYNETQEYSAETQIYKCSSLEKALHTASEITEKTSGLEDKEIFIAGGASIYKQAIIGAEKLYISRIPGIYEGDTFFPEISDQFWNLDAETDYEKFMFQVYSRKK